MPPSPIRLISADQLRELPPTEVLGDTKFIARGFNVVFGASGAFKSFYMLNAALSLAQVAPVVYVAAEGAGGLHRRVAAWCEHYQMDAGQLYFVCQEINLLSVNRVQSLISAISKMQPHMVVFDTLARCMVGGDENQAKDMGIAIDNSALVQRELNCAVSWVHHSNRAERGERGSGAMRGAADAMIELSANGDSVIRVSCSKLKDDEPWPTEQLRFLPIGESGILVSTSIHDEGRSLSAQEMQVLEFLSLDVFETSGAKAAQIGNSLNISERNIYRILSHLKRELHISHDSKGDPYRLTDQGKSLMRKTSAKKDNVITLVKSGTSEASDTSANELQDFVVI